MADESTTTLKLVSDEMGVLGPTLKTSVHAIPTDDGRYLVSRSEWDATLGPVFNRAVSNIHSSRNDTSYHAIANGYQEMDSAETEGFHNLVQAFAAADELQESPEAFDKHMSSYTNPDGALAGYGEKLSTFAHMYVDDDHVLLDKTQLQGLADMARRTAEYALENDVGETGEAFAQDKIIDNPRMRYSHGLLNLIL